MTQSAIPQQERRLWVLDFDGTFTDVEKEAQPFVEAYTVAAHDIVGPAFDDAWQRWQHEVQTNPGEHGWKYENHVVAPANSDPYLRATVTMSLILEELDMFPDPIKRTALLEKLYHENYPKADTVFRPDAKEIVETLLATDDAVAVVTNSDTATVAHKLEKLAPRGADKLLLRGNARKFLLAEPQTESERWQTIPESVRPADYPREVFLRRGHYFDELENLWKRTETQPETTFVAGDIYELDLALPSMLGAKTHLVASDKTLPYERDAVLSHGGGSVGTLADILP